MPRILWVYSIEEFKTEEQRLRHRKGKCSHSSNQLHRICKRGTSWAEQPSSLSSCLDRSYVIQLAICLFEIHVFEMDALVIKGSSRVWLCNPTDYNLPVSSVHGLFQARILEWVSISFSRGSSWPRDQTCISCIVGIFFTTEPPGKPNRCSKNAKFGPEQFLKTL